MRAAGCGRGDTRTFTAAGDASATAARPSVNRGGARWLVVGRSRVSYLKFDVSLPEGAAVTEARLRLFSAAGRRRRTALLRAGNWTESALSWRNRPGGGGRRALA